ncbi:UNVERIFIED_CONTAM: hypothetical protein FKN15_028497 [Acipenser sinensis]
MPDTTPRITGLDFKRLQETEILSPDTAVGLWLQQFESSRQPVLLQRVTPVADTAAAAWSAQDQYYCADTRSMGDDDVIDSAPDDDRVTPVADTAAAAWSAQDQYYCADTRSMGDDDVIDSAPDDDRDHRNPFAVEKHGLSVLS